MRNIVITKQELDTIMKLIGDFGFEYGLKCTLDEVVDLRTSLESCYDIKE